VDEAAPLEFRTIQLPRDSDICVRFRRDSFACSFAGAGRFDREYGPGGEAYLEWLATRIAEFPQGFVHIWRSGEIIGQIEGRPRGEPPVGYVNLFYLAPALRGRGLGLSLHQYAVSIFKSAGVETLELSVSPSNGRAVAFYRKHGWRDLGPRENHPEVHLMELSLRPR
jgi:ribosomal protein S18 acetylase RimI-like enzyme